MNDSELAAVTKTTTVDCAVGDRTTDSLIRGRNIYNAYTSTVRTNKTKKIY